MKKNLLILIFTLFLSSAANADELENTLNKVYSKGSEVAEGYISNLLSGPGDTEVSIGLKEGDKPIGSIMIVRPYSVKEDSVIFYQAQFNSYYVLGDTRQSLNYGVGKRFLSADKNSFWGVNTFVDLDIESNSRLGFGSEFKASTFDISGNYYLDVLGGGNQVGTNTERVLDGYDFNVSGQVPYLPWMNINYNNYVWKKEKNTQDSKGEIYTGTLNVTNNITMEVGYDDNNIIEENAFVKLIYIHGGPERPTMDDGISSVAFQDSDVSEKMLTKVKRSNIITLEVEGTGVVIANGN